MSRKYRDPHFYGDDGYDLPTSHFIYGDSAECFYWACQLAQTIHSQYGFDVFVTSATKENFMDGYKDEQCLIVLGLNPNDISSAELWDLLCCDDWRIFKHADVHFTKTVIITSPYNIEAMTLAYGKEDEDWIEVCGSLNHIYEVRNAGKFGVANVTTYQYTPSETNEEPGTLEAKMIDRGVDLLQLLDIKNATNDYFEKYDYNKIWAGMPEELTCFLRQVKYLPIFEQQKLWAMMNSHKGATVSPMFAKHCLQNLRSCEYSPALRTIKDCGYQQIKELSEDYLKYEVQPFIDFGQAGEKWLNAKSHKEGKLTPYGYIKGLPDYEVQQEFIIPIDTDRLCFEPNYDDMYKLGVYKLPF